MLSWNACSQRVDTASSINHAALRHAVCCGLHILQQLSEAAQPMASYRLVFCSVCSGEAHSIHARLQQSEADGSAAVQPGPAAGEGVPQ